jgi:hypothetical protein
VGLSAAEPADLVIASHIGVTAAGGKSRVIMRLAQATRRGLLTALGLAAAEISPDASGARADGMVSPILPNQRDVTAEFVRAMQIKNTRSDGTSIGGAIFLPKGTYRLHELPWDGLTSFVGEEVGSTVLKYNGRGGRGSYVLGLDKRGGSVPFAGFYNMTMDGFNDDPAAPAIAEHGCYFQADIDWGWKHENIQYQNFHGDAIRVDGEVFNLHMDRIRWDHVGGWGLSIAGRGTQEHRPLTITRFSYDNAMIPGPFQVTARRMGVYNGREWGRGVLTIGPYADGVAATVADGRVELNHPSFSTAGLPSWIMLRHSGTGAATSLLMQNVTGFFHPDTPGAVVFSSTGGISAAGQNVGAGNAVATYFDRSQPERTTSSFVRNFVALANPQQDQGIAINGAMIEFRDCCPDEHVVDGLHETGSIVFNAAAGPGGNLGWIRTSAGPRAKKARILTPAARAVEGSARLVVPRTDFASFRPGRGLILSAIGPGDGDLAATVIDLDGPRSEVILSDAAERGAQAVTVFEATPHWEPFGIVGVRPLELQPPSAATDVVGLLSDFNALLRKLQDAKLMGT